MACQLPWRAGQAQGGDVLGVMKVATCEGKGEQGRGGREAAIERGNG